MQDSFSSEFALEQNEAFLKEACFSVAELNNYLKNLIENDFLLRSVLVKGEISNFKQYKQGSQWYFTIKDDEAQLNCVVFQTKNIKFLPQDGDEVLLKGRVTVFNKRGTYNLQVFWLEPSGVGAIARSFDQLKEKLTAEGLFEAEFKKEMPFFPQKIAVLAAPGGAAVRDIIKVAKGRDTGLEIVVFPTVVQGVTAGQSIVKNINLADEQCFDLLVLARGGGSLEDLQAFNEEAVARAIFAAQTPIVSAVGHEVDYTIADFVADLRAPTPSAAAEMVVPDIAAWQRRLMEIKNILNKGFERFLTDQYQYLATLQLQANRSLVNVLEKKRTAWEYLNQQLATLNPLAVLKRGFGVVEKEGKTIFSVKELSPDDIINIRLNDGLIKSEVLKIINDQL